MVVKIYFFPKNMTNIHHDINSIDFNPKSEPEYKAYQRMEKWNKII